MDVDAALAQVRSDASLRAQLRVARAWGVSPGRFSGREPARRIVRDDLGQIVRVEVEPEWTDRDRALALALEVVEADTCSGCGLPLSETTQADRDGLYLAAQPVQCHACAALGQGANAYSEHPHPQALRFPVTYHPPVSDAEIAALVDEEAAL